jgi:hypothetical protein
MWTIFKIRTETAELAANHQVPVGQLASRTKKSWQLKWSRRKTYNVYSIFTQSMHLLLVIFFSAINFTGLVLDSAAQK